jgi:cation:H+ antiporter
VITLVEFGFALVAILVAAALFTNAVEILGERLNLAHGAVGSVLAAVGTALPETMIPVVAILGSVFAGERPEESAEIGVGAILGGALYADHARPVRGRGLNRGLSPA